MTKISNLIGYWKHRKAIADEWNDVLADTIRQLERVQVLEKENERLLYDDEYRELKKEMRNMDPFERLKKLAEEASKKHQAGEELP